jgi:hypothetical protein
MSPRVKVAAFAGGAAVVVSVSLMARASSQAAGAVTICAGADGVLRAAPAGAPCPGAQKTIPVVAGGAGGSSPTAPRPLPGVPKPASVGTLIADLERRLREVERTARFEVVDKAGNLVFRVGRESTRVYNSDGSAVAAIMATEAGGIFTAKSADRIFSTSFGSHQSRTGVLVEESGLTRVDLGKQESGNFSARFLSRREELLSGIGESRAGTGALIVADAAAVMKASLTVIDGKGTVGIVNGQHGLLSLTEGETQGGLLAIGDATANAMVKMGVYQDRYGIVLTFPTGPPWVPALGIPGSSIMGKPGG